MRRWKPSILMLPLLLVWCSAARADDIEDTSNTSRKFIQAAVEADLGGVEDITTAEYYADLKAAKGATLAEKISPDLDLADLGGVTKAFVRAKIQYSQFSIYQ